MAAAPELYPVVVACGGVASIVSLVAHENADVSASACALLYDLTDPDAPLPRLSGPCVVVCDSVSCLYSRAIQDEPPAYVLSQSSRVVLREREREILSLSRFDAALQARARDSHTCTALKKNAQVVTNSEQLSACSQLVDAFVAESGLELLVANVERFDATSQTLSICTSVGV